MVCSEVIPNEFADVLALIPHSRPDDGLKQGIVPGQIESAPIEEGVHLGDLAEGARLEVSTRHHVYSIINAGEGKVWISGHPDYCAQPVEVLVSGSNWGGAMLKSHYIGRGMRLEFWHPVHNLVTTSKITDIRRVV
jgi:hypothetical protein